MLKKAKGRLVLLVIMAGCLGATAQTNTAVLDGVVADQSGSVIPGATVTATDIQTGISKSEVCDEMGRYVISNLAPSVYNVQVKKEGFTSTERKNQQFLVGAKVTINFTLQVGSVNQTVEVTSAPPMVETEQSDLDRVIQTNELNTLPILNRNFSSLAALSPGVFVNTTGSTNPSGTNIQFGDSMAQSNGYFVDGSTINKMNHGGLILNFAQDWVQEFSVITQLATAEYGSASSGYINAITRSGTNTVHGRAYGYFQNAALNAKPSFLPASAPNKPPYDQQRLGGYLGGPIKTNKLFYFLGYEWLNNLTSTAVNLPAAFTGPGLDAGVFPKTTVTDLAMAKLDYQINPAQAIHLRANDESDLFVNSGIGASGSSITSFGAGSGEASNAQIYLLTWDDILSPSTINELRGELYGNYLHSTCNYANVVGPYTGGGASATPYGNPTGWFAEETYSSAGVTAGCTALYGGQGERDWAFNDTYTVVHGNHQIKVGVNAGYRNFYNRAENREENGVYTIAGLAPFNPSTAALANYPISYVIYWNPGNGLTTNSPDPYFGMFAQDTWKATKTLTLNLGIRYDLDFANSFIDTVPDLNRINNDPTDLGPRAGFAWTPFHDNGRTVLRGGAGVFYDQSHADFQGTYILETSGPTTALSISYNSAAGNPYCFGNNVCANGVPAAYQQDVQEVLASSLANSTFPNFHPPGGIVRVGSKQYTIPTLTFTQPRTALNVDEDFKNPATLQATLGIARQITDNFGASADFAYIYGFNQAIVRNTNINNVTFAANNPDYSTLDGWGDGGFFRTYSLRMQGHYRDHRGDNFQLAYTLDYAFDNSAGTGGFTLTTSGTTLATNPFNYNVDYGPAVSTPKDLLNVSSSINIYWGIQFSPILNFDSAIPYTATTTLRTSGCPVYYSHCYPTGYTKGSLLGADTFTLDGRIAKVIKFGEKYSAMLMFEAYNMTNRANFGNNFQANVASPQFMQPIGAGPRRNLQAGFQFDF